MGLAVNANQTTMVPGTTQENSKKDTQTMKYQEGDIVQGKVSKVTDQISIQFSERTVTVSKETLPSAKEGDLLNFQVTKHASDGTFQLKYLPDASQSHNKGVAKAFTAVLGNVKGQQDVIAAQKEDSVKEAQEQLSEVEDKMTEEDYNDLSKEGVSLEQYEVERFDRALERIKEQRNLVQDSIDSQVESVKQKDEDIQKAKVAAIDDPRLKQQIEAILQSMSLPANKNNIAMVHSALEMAQDAVNLNSASMNYLISNELEPTSLNIYMANHNAKAGEQPADPQKESDWVQLEGQVSDLLNTMNQDASMEKAKWLYDHDIAINQETLTKYQNLVNLQQNFNIDIALNCIVNGMAQGEKAMNVSLNISEELSLKSAVEDFQKVTDEALDAAVGSGNAVTLDELRTQMDAEKQDADSSSSKDQKHAPQGQIYTEDIQKQLALVTARRQLEEIRVKLTYEAGQKLADKGIHIDTQELSSLVSELRNLETEYYQKLLAEGQTPVTSQNVHMLRATMELTDTLKQSPAYVLGVKFAEHEKMTLSSLGESGSQMTDSFRQANEAYEPLATAPRGDMGDSIKKAFANMDSLLNELGIEGTEANKRAVRILSYNQMEINETSVAQMKAYDRQVSDLIEALKPSTTVQLIKEGVNPLDTPIEELTEYVNEIQKENGASSEEKYSTYLTKIQKSKTLSSEERDSYIGIYRLLNNVEKSDGKAIGYLVKGEREITLNNLLSAVRSIKGAGINVNIDDSFGALKDVTYSSKSISAQLDAAFAHGTPLQAATAQFNETASQDLMDHLSPDFLQHASEKTDLMNASLEQLDAMCKEYEALYPQTNQEEYANFISQAKEAADSIDEIRFLKDYNRKTSISSIQAAKVIMRESNGFFQQTADAIGGEDTNARLEETFLNASSMAQFASDYEKVVNSIEQGLRDSFEHPTLTVEDMLNRNKNLNTTSLLKELGEQQYYQIPVKVNGEVVGVGVSLQSMQGEKGRVSIHLNSKTFGEVNAEFSLEGQSLKGLVTCENKPSTAVMSHVVEEMKSNLPHEIENVQVHVCETKTSDMSYHMQNNVRENDTVRSESLFEIAKEFIVKIKEIDQ